MGLIAESCRKPNTNNQQLLKNKLKLTLKYALNLRFETRGFNSQFPIRPDMYYIFQVSKFLTWKGHFLVYFNKPTDISWKKLWKTSQSKIMQRCSYLGCPLPNIFAYMAARECLDGNQLFKFNYFQVVIEGIWKIPPENSHSCAKYNRPQAVSGLVKIINTLKSVN